MSADRNVYLVTGGGSGIGAATAQSLAGDGHRVFACGRNEGRLQIVAADHATIEPIPCDVSRPDRVEKMFERIEARTDRLDGVVNAAGLFGAIGKFHETDPDAWLQPLQVHVGGTYLVSRRALPLLRRSSSPRIVNFAGGGAFEPFPCYSAYAVSKAAVVRLTETMAVELSEDGIRVNAVAPGFVATRIHEATLATPDRSPPEHVARTRQVMSGEAGVPMETAVGCVRFLLSSTAGVLTGKTLSASFDPWDRPGFPDLVPAINTSPLYTMQRINPKHLPKDDFRSRIAILYEEKHGKSPLH